MTPTYGCPCQPWMPYLHRFHHHDHHKSARRIQRGHVEKRLWGWSTSSRAKCPSLPSTWLHVGSPQRCIGFTAEKNGSQGDCFNLSTITPSINRNPDPLESSLLILLPSPGLFVNRLTVNTVMGQLLRRQTASTQLILTPFADVVSSHLSSEAVERKVNLRGCCVTKLRF